MTAAPRHLLAVCGVVVCGCPAEFTSTVDASADTNAADGSEAHDTPVETSAMPETMAAPETGCSDDDGDGEGSRAAGRGTDCNDTNKDVFSKQTKFFETPYDAGAASFDYNCDGVEERGFTTKVACTMFACSEGWAETIPSCGASGWWATSCKTWMSSSGGNVCSQFNAVMKKQACR